MRWLDSVLEATGMSLAKLREAVEDRGAWRALVYGVMKSRARLTTEQQLLLQVWFDQGIIGWHYYIPMQTRN